MRALTRRRLFAPLELMVSEVLAMHKPLLGTPADAAVAGTAEMAQAWEAAASIAGRQTVPIAATGADRCDAPVRGTP